MSDLLNERQKTHGDFVWNAYVSQRMKDIFRAMEHDKLGNVHAEALDMIAVKMGRILSGNANHKDHWEDIIGYATLALGACEND